MRAFRGYSEWAQVAVLLATALVLATGAWASVIRMRALLPFAAIAFVGVAWHRRRFLFRTGSRPVVIVLIFAVSAALAVQSGLARSGDVTFSVGQALVTVLFGWIAVMVLAMKPAGPASAPGSPAWSRPAAVIGLASTSFVVLAVCTRLGERWFGIDEVLYMLQARLFAGFEYVWHWNGASSRFFSLPLSLHLENGLIPHFPPGYPVILAALIPLGLHSYSGALLGTAAIMFTYLLGRSVHSQRAGVIAAALLATQFWFVQYGASYLSHVAAMVPLCAAGWLLVRSEARDPRGRIGHWYLAGVLLGAAVTIRPLTGVAVAASLWLWILVRRRLGTRALAALTVALALGALIPGTGLLLYNSATTGSPWLLGYSAAHGEWAALGFGERGFMLFDEDARPTPWLMEFTPALAVRYFLDTIWALATWVLPLFVVLPLLGAAHIQGFVFRWRTIAAFLPLPLVHFFYYGNAYRFHLELLPFIFVGLAPIILHLWERNPSVGRSLAVFLLCANLIAGGTRLAELYARQRDGYSGSGYPYLESVRAAQEQHGRILVFVRDPAPAEPLFISLSWFNAIAFPGDVIVARDLDAMNSSLMRRFPNHVPLLATWPAGDEPAAITHLPRSGAPAP